MRRPEARGVSGHRRAQLHESGRAGRARYFRSPDQGLWRYRGRRIRDRADVGRRARHRPDGPRDARRQLAARGRHATHRQDPGADRLRRHRRGSRPHRARRRHARHCLEPVNENLSGRPICRSEYAPRRVPCRLAASPIERRNPRLPFARADRLDAAGRDPRQHRARCAGRRDRDDRRARVGSHPARRARRLQHRAAAGGSSADQASECDAVGAFGLPHAGGERESDWRSVGALQKDCDAAG